jgi:acetyl-CoA carboxylase carboxyltransferase component
VLTGFARFGGITVGVIANQSLHLAGAFDCNGFRKMSRFLNFMGAFNFPMVSFVDVPGAIPTVQQHKEGILTHGSQLLQAFGHLKSLKISIVVRRCFGGAYCVMTPKISGGDIIYAYPGAMIGIMSDQAMRSFLKETAPIQGRLDDPFIAAALGYVDDVIEPAQTRYEIIRALKLFHNKRFLDIPPKWLNNPPL